MTKPTKPTQAELRAAGQKVNALLIKLLGKDECGDAYAKGLVIDNRIHEHFPYYPEVKRTEETEQAFTDAVTRAEINLQLATKQLEQANREFRYWLEERRYKQSVENAVSKATNALASYTPVDLAFHIYEEVYCATNTGSHQQPDPNAIAKEVQTNIRNRLPGRHIERLCISTQYSTRIYASYTPTKAEVEKKIQQQQQAIAEVTEALMPAQLKARGFSNSKQRQAFIKRAIANREHTFKAMNALRQKI